MSALNMFVVIWAWQLDLGGRGRATQLLERVRLEEFEAEDVEDTDKGRQPHAGAGLFRGRLLGRGGASGAARRGAKLEAGGGDANEDMQRGVSPNNSAPDHPQLWGYTPRANSARDPHG